MLLVQADSTGSSVDPQGTVEDMVVQASTAAQTSNSDHGGKDGTKDNTQSSIPAGPPPKR